MPRAMAPASPERKKRRRTRPAAAAAAAGAQEAHQQHGTPAVKAEVHSPLPATHGVARGGRGLSACSDDDEDSDGGDDGPFTPAVTGGDGMRSAVPKTIANPLYGASRREFRRVVSGMRGSGEGIFGIIDDDIARILEAVSRLAETAYDSYNKAAKRIITAGTAALAGRANSAQARGQEAHPHHHATPQGDPSALAHAIAMGNQAKEELRNAQNRYRLLDAMCSRQADLFSQLHAASNDAVQVCHGMQWMAPPIAKLAAILGSCRPDAGLQKGGSAPSSSSSSNGARARSAANDTDYCSPPVFERLVREMSDIESILYDYKEMQTRVLELTRELRALRRQGVVPGMQPSMPVAAHPAAAAATVRPAKRARANVSCI